MEDPPLTELREYLKEAHVREWKKGIESEKTLGKQALMKLAHSKRHPGWSDFEYDHWAEAKLLVRSEVVGILIDENLQDPARFYPKITTPALILKADTDQAHRQKNHEIADRLPNGTIVHIDGAGHLIRLDKPAETESRIRAFLTAIKR